MTRSPLPAREPDYGDTKFNYAKRRILKNLSE